MVSHLVCGIAKPNKAACTTLAGSLSSCNSSLRSGLKEGLPVRVKGWWGGAGGSDDDEDGSSGSCVNVKNTKRIGEIRGKQHYSGFKLEKELI